MRVSAGQPDEIVLPETEPETEWLRGRAVRKMSPTRDHGRIQGRLVERLGAWAIGRGEVVPEWRFRFAPPGEMRRPLVPDVAFVSYTRMRGVSDEALQAPEFPPDVAFEIRSIGDDPEDIREKIRVYLACDVGAVIVVDPRRRSLRVIDPQGERLLDGDATFEHPALPGFRLPLADLFSALDRPDAV